MCPCSPPGTNHSLAFPLSSATECWWCRIQNLHSLSSPLCGKGESWWALPCYSRALAAWVSHAGLKGDPLRLFVSWKTAQQSHRSLPGDLKCGRVLEIPAHLCAAGICLFAPCTCGHPADVPPPKGCRFAGTDSTAGTFCCPFLFPFLALGSFCPIFLLHFNLVAVHVCLLWGDVKFMSSLHGKPKWISLPVQSLKNQQISYFSCIYMHITPPWYYCLSIYLTLVFSFQPQQWPLLLTAARERCEPPHPTLSVIFMWKLNGTGSPEHPPGPSRPPRGDCTAWPGILETQTLTSLAGREHGESKLSSSRAGRFKR